MNEINQYINLRIKNINNQLKNLECAHPKNVIRCRNASNKSKMYKLQCTRCGELIGNWIPHSDLPANTTFDDIDDGLRETYRQNYYELRTELLKRKRLAEKSDFYDWYNTYLKSGDWIDKRKRVISRCKNICEGCGKSGVDEVHHKTYKNVGNEFLFELLGLCLNCHEIIHQDQEQKNGDG